VRDPYSKRAENEYEKRIEEDTVGWKKEEEMRRGIGEGGDGVHGLKQQEEEEEEEEKEE